MYCDCETLKGRKREICEGRADLPLSVVNQYRNGWGLPDLSSEAWAAAAASRTPTPVPQARPPIPGGCVGCRKKPQQSILERAAERISNLKTAAVDFWRDGMHIASEEQQAARLALCGACPLNSSGWCDSCGCNLALKVKARAAYCPVGKWFAHGDNYRPLVDSTRHLMFHVYPLLGKEWNWHWHIEQIRKYADHFNGKIVIAVATDRKTATLDTVQALCDGIPVAHWVHADNTKEMAETATHVEMLRLLQTTDENDIIFRYHTKGVTHQRESVEQRWADILWQTNLDLPSVYDALASHLTCGALRSQTPLVARKGGNFFFAGSAYWMRAKEVFERDWQAVERNRWWVEYAPAHLFTLAESACLFHDLTESSVLTQSYFTHNIDPEYAVWQQARELA